MEQKRNPAQDIVTLGGTIDTAEASEILERWMNEYPTPRNPLFNLSLLPYLKATQTWMLVIGGSAGTNELRRPLDPLPLTVEKVITESRLLVDYWRNKPAEPNTELPEMKD